MPRVDKIKLINIVLVSPSDLQVERKICRNSIAAVNSALEAFGKNYRVKLVGWEDIPPGTGRPNAYIGKSLDIGNCGIVIGMFWYRFGSPPGASRPDDGVPYKSGTEEELESAFQSRKLNGHPEIMIYWKRDKLPKFVSDEDYIQYARLIEFMRDCRPTGRHPAYYVEFQSKQFEKRLSQDLLKVLNGII